MAGFEPYLDWPLAKDAALKIHSELKNAELSFDEKGKSALIKGTLPLGDSDYSTKAMAQCRFKLRADWLRNIPHTHCDASWLKREIDWHAYSDGGLCFDLGLFWSDEIFAVVDAYGHVAAAEFARIWLVRSVRSLVRRHLVAHRVGITDWSSSWADWKHGRKGVEQYFQMKRQGRPPSGR